MVSIRILFTGLLAFMISGAIFAQTGNPLLDSTTAPAFAGAQPLPAPVVLSPEKRADIFMARKMYREAIETYREAPMDSAVIWNKIGIAYHQMLNLDLARKRYEHA